MIIKNQSNEVEISGKHKSKRAKISENKLGKLQYLLTKGLYKDPITAVIAEWTNNGVDAIVQSGKDPVQNPVVVTIDKNNLGQWYFSVEDKGIGLDEKDFEDICMNYLESTKDTSDDLIGSFGIGMKSFLALDPARPAIFTCRKNGVERRYLVYEGTEFVDYDLISEVATLEENGVKAELIINDEYEMNQFERKAKQKLSYYDTVVLKIDGKLEDWEIFRNDLFQTSTLNTNSTLHLCLKDVYYSIDWEALGITSINIPVALRFSLRDGITPTPSRESYITNEATKKLILSRIQETADWLVDRFNSEQKTYDTFLEAYPYIGRQTYTVKLEKDIIINPIISQSTKRIEPIKIKNVKIHSPEFYANLKDDLLYELTAVSYYDGNWSSSKIPISKAKYLIEQRKLGVVVRYTPTGNIRGFLKAKYGSNTMFLVKDVGKRRLMMEEYNFRKNSYVGVLDLRWSKKAEWRDTIKEWQMVRDQIFSLLIDETAVDTTQEFTEWVEEKKRLMRENRGHYSGGSYDSINKQKGEITLGYSRKALVGRSVVFQKKAHKIQDVMKNKYLTILIMQDDDIKKAKVLATAFCKVKDKYIKFATVGKLEYNKLPKHFQFKKFSNMVDIKPFKRLATAMLFQQAVQEFNKVFNYKSEVLKNCLKGVADDVELLKTYISEHNRDIDDEDIQKWIFAVAEELNLWDKELWDVYLRVKEASKKYDFVTCFEEPSYWDHEQIKKYNRIITQLLLFRKKYYNDFPEGAIITFEEPEAQEEEGEEDEEFELEEETI